MTDKQQNTILRAALLGISEKLGEKQESTCSYCRERIFTETSYVHDDNDMYCIDNRHIATPSTPTLAETLQAICASALGEIEVGDAN